MARRRVSYRLSDEALAGFDRMATRNGITITALLEAFGQLARHRDPDGLEVVTRARAIDRERRSRR